MKLLKDVYGSPLPPMALTDYETLSKFLNSAAHRCKESGRELDLFLDWTIRALLNSLSADSAARIFLPKTKTDPFTLDDVIPLSSIRPSGRKRIPLKSVTVVAPVWNNSDVLSALEAFCDSGFQDTSVDKPFGGAYIDELRLAIVDSPSDVAIPHVLHTWGRGAIVLDSYSLKDLKPVLWTDGDVWSLQTEGGEERTEPVLEPRMAALYNCGLRRYHI